MGDVYGIFALGFAGVATLGAVTATWSDVTRYMDRIGVLVTVIVSLTGAGLLSLAFMVDKIVASEMGITTFFQGSSAWSAFAAVLWMLAAGSSGLLASVVLTIWGAKPARGRAGTRLRRWGAGIVAVSAVAVVLLFPSVVVLIFSTHDSLLAPAP